MTMSGGRYFISIQTRREVPEPVHPSSSSVGIDVGITRFATLSDETVIEPLNSLKKHQHWLRHYQRMMSRRQKFSNNWKKAKARVNRVANHIANARRDFLHKVSTTISKNHAVVIVEDLKIRNMSQSAAGTVEQPGTNVKRKSGLNRSILDQGWGIFHAMLDYKTAWRGGRLVTRDGASHQPDLSRVRARVGGQPENAGAFSVRPVRIREQRRSGRGDQSGARISLVSLSRYFACSWGVGAGTHRSCSGGYRLRAVGISGLQAGEDVKTKIHAAATTARNGG